MPQQAWSATGALALPRTGKQPLQSDTKFPGADFCGLTRSWPVADLIAPPAVQSGPFTMPYQVRLEFLFSATSDPRGRSVGLYS